MILTGLGVGKGYLTIAVADGDSIEDTQDRIALKNPKTISCHLERWQLVSIFAAATEVLRHDFDHFEYGLDFLNTGPIEDTDGR